MILERMPSDRSAPLVRTLGLVEDHESPVRRGSTLPSFAKEVVRLHQLEHLCQRFGPDTINWRFDPLCFFKTGGGPQQDNLHEFCDIAAKAAECGIVRCITSFMDHYPKIRRRLSTRPGFAFIDPILEKKIEIVANIISNVIG